MFEALFGTEMPLALRFFIAFVIVLALIGAAAYLVRRFGATALNAAVAARGRQPRLAVIDAATIDGRRRLVLIRHDNVEHLVMIGGPTDVVIEPNIVRATATAPARETPPARVTGGIADALPRAVPLAEGGMWPLQPEPRPQRASTPVEDDAAAWTSQPEPIPRAAPDIQPRAPASDRFVGSAPDLSRGFGEPEAPAVPRRVAEPRRAAAAPVQPIPENEDHNLAEMAHRLESALQRPRKPAEPEPVAPPAPRGNEAAPAEPKAVRPEPKPSAKPAFDSLEQEMASLLGRPSGKA
ncbi:MAG: flagellar protein FliO/FliZ [Alphaproteobacteria bacterium]|nr:flagellar protein FliO/FliZ [Alphaproteobacteria bacterium]